MFLNVDDLKMKNIHISYKDEDFRPAMLFDDVKGLNLSNVAIPTAKEMPVLVLRNVKNQLLEQVILPVENKKGIFILNK